jgi:hypothetical protein
METKPPKKEDRARTKQLDPLEANKTEKTVSKAAAIGKSCRSFVDHWQEARINYLDGEVTHLKAGPIARRFFEKARARYRQYTGCDCPKLRYLCWSALDIVAGQLVHPPGSNAK